MNIKKFQWGSWHIRKSGSAALDLAYVAAGRYEELQRELSLGYSCWNNHFKRVWWIC